MAFRDENDLKDPRAAILLNRTCADLPPCLFIVAELDPVRDLSYGMNAWTSISTYGIDSLDNWICLAYQELLDRAGMKTELVLLKGVVHPYFALPGMDAASDFIFLVRVLFTRSVSQGLYRDSWCYPEFHVQDIIWINFWNKIVSCGHHRSIMCDYIWGWIRKRSLLCADYALILTIWRTIS